MSRPTGEPTIPNAIDSPVDSTETRVHAGQAVYTRRNLRIYDTVVHRLSNQLAWGCPTRRLIQDLDRNLSANHVDVGVGTGLLLLKSKRGRAAESNRQPEFRLGLVDLNHQALDFAARRLHRWQPVTCHCNVLQPLPQSFIDVTEKFDSLGLGYLLHCLPGSMAEKCRALDHLRSLMNPRATVFGSTILGQGVSHNWLGRRLMSVYNHRGIFSNRFDSAEALRFELNSRFDSVSTEVIGRVALFSAQIPM